MEQAIRKIHLFPVVYRGVGGGALHSQTDRIVV